MPTPPRPFDIVHVTSAHPWTDGRVHLRAAGAAARAGWRTALVAVATTDSGPDRDWSTPDPETGVYVRRIRSRRRWGRVVRSTAEAVAAALASRARVVHLHDPELLWAVPLLRAAARNVVFDAHEDLPVQIGHKEYLGPLTRRLATVTAFLAIFVAARADAIVAATPAIAVRFPPARTTVVRNVPVIRPVDAAAAPVTRRSLSVVCLGSISRARGLDVLTDTVDAELPPGWRMVTAGPIDAAVDRGRFDELCGRGRITHLGVVGPTVARDLLLDARIGLLLLLPTPAYSVSIPTKLFEYLAAGLAVIATDVPFWREMLDGGDFVTWVPPADPAAVVSAIETYAEHPDLLAEHADAGRAFVLDRFRWDRESETLLEVYDRFWPVRPFGTDAGSDRAAR